jgi:LysM repeat protein
MQLDIINDFIPNKNKSENVNNETKDNFRICQNTQRIIHTIGPKDTLQGLAFKYGVTIADLKKENKLATDSSMYSKKEIFIPTTQKQLNKTLELKNHKIEKANFELQQLTQLFLEKTGSTDEEVAIRYLKHSALNLQRAIEIYELETQVQESVRKLRVIANNRSSLYQREEATDTTKLLGPASYNQYYHHSFDTTQRREIPRELYISNSIEVEIISKKKRESMSNSYNDIYDL